MLSAADAQSHMEATLFSRLAGNYTGSYAGDDTGTWSVVINDAGGITGSGQSNAWGSFSIAGTVASSGSADFTSGIAAGNQVAAVYAGTFDADAGTAPGTWDGGCCEHGIWSGTRQ